MARKGLSAILICLLLCLAGASAHAANMARVKTSGDAQKARVVFEFPRLVGFRAEKTDKGAEITFLTDMGSAKPVNLPAAITSFDVERPEPRRLKVTLGLKDGLDFKAMPQQRNVVVDIFPAAAKKPPATPPKTAEKKPTPAPAPQKEKPQEAAQPETAKQETAPPPPAAALAPAPTPPPQAAAPETHAAKDSADDDDEHLLPLAEQAKAAPAPGSDEDTKITVSTVSPTRIAVFKRFGFLWIVADRQLAGAFPPEVEGKMSGFLGKPQFFKFGEGSAWRYRMPPRTYLSVKKKSLTWQVSLTRAPEPKPLATPVTTDIDQTSRKARLTVMMPSPGHVLKFEDPAAGDTLYVVPSAVENARVANRRHFVDVEILPAAMGFVARPLRDFVTVDRISDYVQITSPAGLSLSSNAFSSIVAIGMDDGVPNDLLFNFPDWRGGGIDYLEKNARLLLQEAAEAKSPEERQGSLMQLARLYFANRFAHETLGVLRMLADENEDMAKTPEYIALLGAANALAGHYQDAMRYLSNPMIQKNSEVNLWIGYAAAATEQWHKANASFPQGNRLLIRYPDDIAVPFTIYMAESALRLAHPDTAEALLGTLGQLPDALSPQYNAAIRYLRGETARQKGDLEAAQTLWEPVAEGIDRLYHTKASLALANLRLQEGKITLPEAIDTVDSLRFAWRGDGLEVQILHNLGELKIRNGKYLDGLKDMQAAAKLANLLLDDPGPIQESIRRVFADLFVGSGIADVPPFEAITIYNEFSSVMPPGADKTTASLNFADKLIRMDLLDRAADILRNNLAAGQIANDHVAAVGARLAAVYLLDGKPDKALSTLQSTARNEPADQREPRALLAARALSQLQRPSDAIAAIAAYHSSDAEKLKVDILWRAQQWGAAAAAIAPMLPPAGKKLDEEGARLVLNIVVAAKLAGDAPMIANIKARYADAMAQTPLASAFGVVTRMDGNVALSDRETLLKIAGEVDMFKGFLDGYKQSRAGGDG